MDLSVNRIKGILRQRLPSGIHVIFGRIAKVASVYLRQSRFNCYIDLCAAILVSVTQNL
jgi:hypothetical protein